MPFSLDDIDSIEIEKLKGLLKKYPIQLNIPVIDLQHLWLVHILLSLESLLSSEQSEEEFKEVSKQIISELITFTINHFSLEEKLMVHLRYSMRAEHTKQHRRFIATLEEKIKEKERENEGKDFLKKLLDFLRIWLIDHIMKEDKQYQKFIIDRGVDSKKYFESLIRDGEINVQRQQVLLYNKVMSLDAAPIQEVVPKDTFSEVLKIWKTYSIETKVKVIDIQHLWIIKSILEFEKNLRINDQNAREEVFQKGIPEILKYSVDHFNTEDLVMKFLNIPDKEREAHNIKHRAFVELVNARLKQKREGIKTAIYGLVSDFKEWIISHIAIEDKSIFWNYNQNSSNVEEEVKKLIHEGKIIVNPHELRIYAMLQKAIGNEITAED